MVDTSNSHYKNISLKINNLLDRLLLAINSRDKNNLDTNSDTTENMKI